MAWLYLGQSINIHLWLPVIQIIRLARVDLVASICLSGQVRNIRPRRFPRHRVKRLAWSQSLVRFLGQLFHEGLG